MPNIVRAILAALEKKAVEEYISSCPDKYSRYGRQPQEQKFRTSFGSVSYRLAQLYERQKKYLLHWLKSLRFFLINGIREKPWKAGVGQMIHLFYRMAGKEIRRIKEEAPSESTLRRCEKSYPPRLPNSR